MFLKRKFESENRFVNLRMYFGLIRHLGEIKRSGLIKMLERKRDSGEIVIGI
jgi:hypothetical protein